MGESLHAGSGDQRMNLTITGHNVKITPALEAYAKKKLSRVMSAFDTITSMRLKLRVEPQKASETQHQAQITVKMSGCRPLHTEHACADLYAAIDVLCDKAARQVVNIKTQVKYHKAERTGRMFATGGAHAI